ncbi:MAG: polysaccharide biosynthesis C-terminal domain-containing protein [Oscillospiraceae bacterium]|nr:polysaccharide biosynthesis C-terminal domain-containing protein [Oscillospiraceae bacterium]
MKRQTVLCGAVWLMLSAIAAKLLGAVFRIPLTAMLGGTGMGYYSCAYGIFLPVFALSVTGINAAVAALTASALAKEDAEQAFGIERTAKRMFRIAGLCGSILLFFLAKPLCRYLLHNPQAEPAVRMFAPAVWFCCESAVLRGLYEGRQNMIPTAVSQTAEGIARLFCGLLLSSLVLHHPVQALRFFPSGTAVEAAAAAAAVLGVTISAGAGTGILLLFRIPERRRFRRIPLSSERRREYRHMLSALLIPVSAASLVTNLTTLIDLGTCLRGLSGAVLGNPAAFGLSPDSAAAEADALANFYYGAYTGLAVTVFNLVPAVTNMLGKAVLPAFAEQAAQNHTAQMQKHAEDVLRRTAFLAVPAGLGVMILANPILQFLFASRELETEIASPALSLLGIALIFTALSCPLFSMMQASGHAGDAVTAMLYGAGVKLAGNLLLIPKMQLRGAALSTLLCYLTIFLGSRYLFCRRTGLQLRLGAACGRALFAGLCCSAAAGTLYRKLAVLPQRPALLLSIAGGGVVYLLLMLLPVSKAVSPAD